MPQSHRTPGRLKIATTVLALTNLALEHVVSADHALHSALMMPTNVMVAGVELPILRCEMPLDQALTTFGLVLNAYDGSSVVEGYLANTVGGVIDSANTHTKYARTGTARCCAWVDSFKVQEGGEALAEVIVAFFSSDGDTDPFADTRNNALPALSAVPNNHGIGILTLNGAAYDGITGVSYSCGLQMTVQRTSAHRYVTGGVPSGFKPVLTIDHDDPDALRAVLGSDGVSIASTTTVTFQKYANSALSTTGQRTLTIAQGFARLTPASAKHGGLWKASLEILGSSNDGSTHPFAAS